jgi:hypothetical protein
MTTTDRAKLHDEATREREAFKQANPDKYHLIPAGQSTDIDRIVAQAGKTRALREKKVAQLKPLRDKFEASGLCLQEVGRRAGIDASRVAAFLNRAVGMGGEVEMRVRKVLE